MEGFLLVSFIKYSSSPDWISYTTVCSCTEDGLRCRQAVTPTPHPHHHHSKSNSKLLVTNHCHGRITDQTNTCLQPVVRGNDLIATDQQQQPIIASLPDPDTTTWQHRGTTVQAVTPACERLSFTQESPLDNRTPWWYEARYICQRAAPDIDKHSTTNRRWCYRQYFFMWRHTDVEISDLENQVSTSELQDNK